MTWRNAFYRQAKGDFEAFELMRRKDLHVPLCYQLHYLQMATEKLAKAFRCHPNGPPKRVHTAFVPFLIWSTRDSVIRRELGFPKNQQAYTSYINSLRPVAEKIEALAPAGGNLYQVNAEYPWIDPSGAITVPVDNPFPHIDLAQLQKLVALIQNLFRIFPDIG